jgi:tricorn protease
MISMSARRRLPLAAVLAFLLALAATMAAASGPRPLMRFPDVRGDTIVFVYGEDIWSVPVTGGVARRLTVGEGEERSPKLSPDGSLIAFTGEYDGNVDAYVMNPDGGNITRLTYHPGNDEVVGWHPTKNKVIFRSARSSFSRFDRLFMVSPDGSGLEELPLPEASYGSFSADGGKIAYTRVGVEDRTWKRYHGGLAPDLYVYDFAGKIDRKITDYTGYDGTPMWVGNEIYFASDRDGTLNLWACDATGAGLRQVTRHADYDVRRPSAGGAAIVYELGGTLWYLDTVSGKSRQVPVEIRADAPDRRPYYKTVTDFIQGFDCSPDGTHAAVVARGDVFTVPREEGITRDLTASSGARDKDAAWSPDGKSIAYLSDASGEYEIYVVDAAGKSAARKLTEHKDGYRHTLRWSPDSTKIAFADQALRLWVLDVATRALTQVDKAEYEPVDVALDAKPISDFAWSGDSRWLAYSKMNEQLVSQLWVYSLAEKQARCVSDGLFNDFGPAFARDGEHLFFVSNRRFDPTFCDFEWEIVYKKVAGIYALTLRKDGAALFPPKTGDAAPAAKAEPAKPGAKAEAKAEAKTEVVIDFDGIAGRVEALPVPRGNYRELAAAADALYFLNADEGDFNRMDYRSPGARTLSAFTFADRTARTVIEGIGGYRLSADGGSLIYRKENEIGIVGASARDSKGGALKFEGLRMVIDPVAEWTQIFNEAWRMERDLYYEPGMHGLDWAAIRAKYGALIPYASCRQDVRYLIGEMIGELATSHSYVSGGDRRRKVERVTAGLLGADYDLDAATNRYRFKKIYRVPEWSLGVKPPLAGPGVDVREGDLLLAVNGVEVTGAKAVEAYFQDLAGKPARITVAAPEQGAPEREVVVEPVRSDQMLRYLDWVEHNRAVVDEASGGRIGYIHLPDTYTGSAVQFPKYFYAQTQKQGLVIDGRFNGGGLDPDVFLQRLGKQVLAYWTRRYSHDYTTPIVATRAHMVCLTNRQAGSGGDMLPMEFQMRGLGPVIGTRAWGGLVGYSTDIDLIDGGGLTAPDYRIYDTKGAWIVENVGVTPDIEVDLDPAEVARGYDAQLMKGVETLLAAIDKDPRPWPQHAPFPVKR